MLFCCISRLVVPLHLRLMLPAHLQGAPPLLRERPPGLGRWRPISKWAGLPEQHPEGAVPVLKPDPHRPPGWGLYLLRAERMRPVVQNEFNLRVRLAFRHQWRSPSLLVLPPGHLGDARAREGLACPPFTSPSHSALQSALSFARMPPDAPRKKSSRRWTNRPLGSVVSWARKLRGRGAGGGGSLRTEVTWEVQLDVF